MTTLPFLTDNEINEICSPLVSKFAQVNYLKGLGLKVLRKKNGSPLVARKELERLLLTEPNQRHQETLEDIRATPNRKAFLERLKHRKG